METAYQNRTIDKKMKEKRKEKRNEATKGSLRIVLCEEETQQSARNHSLS